MTTKTLETLLRIDRLADRLNRLNASQKTARAKKKEIAARLVSERRLLREIQRRCGKKTRHIPTTTDLEGNKSCPNCGLFFP